jgi:hypothetical protein
MFICAV